MTQHATTRPFPFFTAVLLLACTALSVLVFVLSRQNRELKAELARAEQPGERARDALAPGQKLTHLTAVKATGGEVLIALDAPGRQLLLIGSSKCPACTVARPFWSELGALAMTTNLPTYCLMTDAPGTPDDEAALSMPVLGIRAFPNSPIAKLPMVPAVLLIRDGVLERLWPGPFDARGLSEIRAALTAE